MVRLLYTRCLGARNIVEEADNSLSTVALGKFSVTFKRRLTVLVTSGCMTIFPSNFREALGDSMCVKLYNKMDEADIKKALHCVL